MSQYKNIDYSKMTYDVNRNYLSVNKAGNLSILYKFLICCLWPLQLWFNDFITWRSRENLIANCKWQIGQLTNVLNFLFDTDQIYLTQATQQALFAPSIASESTTFAPSIASESTTFAPSIRSYYSILAQVTINVPSAIYNDAQQLAELISVCEQIKITGLTYIVEQI